MRWVLALLLAACSPTPPDRGEPDGGATLDAPAVDGPRPDAAREEVTIWAHTRDTLYRLSDPGFDLIPVGTFGVDQSMNDLAVTPDGVPYAISSNALYRVDPETAQATFVAAVPGADNVGMTFLPGGELLATDTAGGVRRIDPQTGVVTEIGEFGHGYATAGDLVAVQDGTMYALSDAGPTGNEYDDNLLLTVDTGTGDATAVGQIGFGRVFGCAYAGGHIYAFTSDGLLVEIDRVTGAGTRLREYPVSFWGAAVTPLVEVE